MIWQIDLAVLILVVVCAVGALAVKDLMDEERRAARAKTV